MTQRSLRALCCERQRARPSINSANPAIQGQRADRGCRIEREGVELRHPHGEFDVNLVQHLQSARAGRTKDVCRQRDELQQRSSGDRRQGDGQPSSAGREPDRSACAETRRHPKRRRESREASRPTGTRRRRQPHPRPGRQRPATARRDRAPVERAAAPGICQLRLWGEELRSGKKGVSATAASISRRSGLFTAPCGHSNADIDRHEPAAPAAFVTREEPLVADRPRNPLEAA